MAIQTILVQLKNPSKSKQKQWLYEQQVFASTVNTCVERINNGEKLSSKNVDADLKAAIKNEAIRLAKQAVTDFKEQKAKNIPTFKNSLGVRINGQNWNTVEKNGRWYMSFTGNQGKKTLPVVESSDVKTFFPWLTKKHNDYRGTIQLLRKGRHWYMAIPIQVSSPLDRDINLQAYTPIGVDVGLRHLAVLSEPISGQRQFFSGKEVGYIRRHFRSLRRSLGKKKAQRAIERVGQKEKRWMKDYNRKLAKAIVDFAMQFDRPLIKMEALDDIRKTAKSMKKADRTIHSWAFYQLKRFIKERAAKHNIPVVDINPYKTSQTCFGCGHAEKDNRHRDRFQCTSCGHKAHADMNAANNIATSTSLAV
ncbi:RNA-guided endonuclease InsQ/TnpB family protein [Natribacillus halophilus]|uniref:Transposase, IS605 OrfB family, central region n=1 Tax=Natribacillus halophilus TaxID=549003 RepID=A0A1G8KWA3_9BACI|nr:RNA-guided endonuclease TnpB family protein [Natribacillus halophilus]SDI47738.1 transposase, IS605 OrfB family, central region [Natribacillus halophilus]